MNDIGEEGAISTPGMMIHCQVPAPTLVGNGILGVLIFKDWQVDFHMASWFPAGPSAIMWMPGSSQPLRH